MRKIQRWTAGALRTCRESDGEWVLFADHERCKQELLELLREWSGTGIADCHCWNTDLRKRTDAALEAK